MGFSRTELWSYSIIRRRGETLLMPCTNSGGKPEKTTVCSSTMPATAFVAEKLAYFKVPAYIEVRRDRLPRNAAGKVMKHVLTGHAENTFVEE